jgi:molecular chaperone GrpE (heat shock protein)
MSTNPETDTSSLPTPDPPDPGEPPFDLGAIAQRMSRMQSKLLGDTSALLTELAELKQAFALLQRGVTESFDKLNASFAMLARTVVTNQVKVDDTHLETRRMFSDQFEALIASLRGELLDRVVERFVLSTIASIIDDVDAVLDGATHDKRSLPAFDALRALRAKLLAGLRPYGVDLVPLIEGETLFDEHYHECTKVDTTSSAATGVVIDRDAQGFLLNDRVVRRARVVVKGAPQ